MKYLSEFCDFIKSEDFSMEFDLSEKKKMTTADVYYEINQYKLK
ncbi:hypothetical protein [Ruminiclostridium herbifermentans]|nr:hypothetical protein [Ruminiclostridium herbifermentans]